MQKLKSKIGVENEIKANLIKIQHQLTKNAKDRNLIERKERAV